ncbi:hypothetical protein HHI36_007469 [Cryptolaemus montrouzieri]|uniref:Rapamycin-insensitive companion of mTOR n=1 Tax=Cryptolaemus montrouzieri TaxID=559131 RepID=A0ABD2MPK7_9CUCU
MTSWMLKHPKLRPDRLRRGKSGDKGEPVDITKDPECVMKSIITGLCGEEKEDKLKFLKAFVDFNKRINGNFDSIGYHIREVLTCLRLSLVHPAPHVRSGGLRAIRHVLTNESDVIEFNNLLIPYLVTRCLDLSLKNDSERLEAMKLIRRVLLLSPSNFHNSLARCLISLANGGIEEKDRMIRICLATLCELGVLSSEQFIQTGGVAAITRNLLECQMPKIVESLCGVLLFMLDKPLTRDAAGVDLSEMATSYCDFHYKHGWKDKNRDERDLRFNCSRLAMLSILRSWPGLLHFCNPNNKSGLKSIVDILYLNQLEVRKAVLDLLYELLGLPQPEWTDELSVALSAVNPSEPQVSWRLNEGFVVAEGQSVLPHLAKATPQITDMHLAVLLYCFHNNGLIGALVEVIATSDTFISVRATVLLGELLRLIQIILPPECCNTSPALPTLLEYATKNTPQAIGAVTALVQFHKLLKKKPASNSLYLDYILKSGNNLRFSLKKNRLISYRRSRSIKAKIHQFVANTGSDIIKETGVLVHKDPLQWNWNLVRIIVKGESGIKMSMTESSHKMFFKRLIDFYLPSNNKYSHMDLSASRICLAYTMVGIELIQFLAQLNENECVRMLTDLFKDILSHINALTSGRSVHDCLFSPQHMINTQCQNYFLFIGRLATMETGVNVLNQINMFQSLQNLATTTNNDCYVKLIVSSMDYSSNPLCRNLLAAILKCNIESSRLYATQFLLILLRSGVPNFASWGIPLLVDQLSDTAKVISLVALSILHEALETSECLEVSIITPINFESLGERGTFLLTRILSHPNGFSKFSKENNIVDEIKKWDDCFMYRYVKQVEDNISDSLTLHQRGMDGKYNKRFSSSRMFYQKDLHLPPHLYGQLSQHSDGFKTLNEHGSIVKFLKILSHGPCNSDEDIIEMKACIWALAHLCTAAEGFTLLCAEGIVAQLIHLAEYASIYSIRATAYYALGLIGTTQEGADEIFKLGWVCTRHNRHEPWPIIQEENNQHSDSENESEDSFLEYSFTSSPTFSRMLEGGKSLREDSFRIGSPERNFDRSSIWRKSSTLPVHRTLSTVYHQRSMSESKTFEVFRNYEHKLRERVGVSSQISNHSTASSLSSGDYYPAPKLPMGQPLSPIPSSSNVVALNKTEKKVRRHSESCRRDSVQSGYLGSSDKSSGHSNSHKLSSQDLLGYTTLHYIRNSKQSNSDPDGGSPSQICIPFNQMNQTEKNISVEDYIFKSSLSSLSSVKKFRVHERSKTGGPCYMGIALPQCLIDLFPDKESINHPVVSSTKLSDTESQPSSLSIDEKLEIIKPNQEFIHDRSGCLECVFNRGRKTPEEVAVTSVSGYLKREILQYIELLSNPLWNKPSKLALLQLKQENPKVFEDACLYSEACRIISENNNRLNVRRIVHELFFEVHYVKIYDEVNSLIVTKSSHLAGKSECVSAEASKFDKERPKSSGVSPSNDMTSMRNSLSNSSFKSITDIGGLKLSYKENKFPIKHRDM